MKVRLKTEGTSLYKKYTDTSTVNLYLPHRNPEANSLKKVGQRDLDSVTSGQGTKQKIENEIEFYFLNSEPLSPFLHTGLGLLTAHQDHPTKNSTHWQAPRSPNKICVYMDTHTHSHTLTPHSFSSIFLVPHS